MKNEFKDENKFKNHKQEPIQGNQQLGPLQVPMNLPMGQVANTFYKPYNP